MRRASPPISPSVWATCVCCCSEARAMATIELKVPDIGDFTGVPVIEVLVKVGDKVEKDQSLVTLESAKATMEVPASAAGVIKELRVKEGDNVSQGSVIAVVEAGATSETKPETARAATKRDEPEKKPAASAQRQAAPTSAKDSGRKPDFECHACVLGSGPGGYTAAFRAADLGLDTLLIERYDRLGGVCLNVGCIPSKALLHAADLINDAELMAEHGIVFGQPRIELDKLRAFKDGVVAKLTGGLAAMAKQRKVRGVRGTGTFVSPPEIEVETNEGKKLVRFEQCIIAAGSQAVKLPGLPWGDPRVMDSTDALMLGEVPKKM